LISAGGLTLSGAPDDVWIFQISQDLTVADGAIITLSGGAQPANIFWQIAGQATIGTAAQFKGIILSQTLISLNTGGSLNGRLLAQTAVTLNGNSVIDPTNITHVNEGVIPFEASLISNYPNPFNPKTNISYNLQEAGYITIEVFNMKGQIIRTLVDQYKEAGTQSVEWNGLDDDNNSVSSGIYFYNMKAGGEYKSTRKMILLK